jgi:hypothetical protein
MIRHVGLAPGLFIAGLFVSSSIALASNANGGHCDYGKGSINVMPQCNTSVNPSGPASSYQGETTAPNPPNPPDRPGVALPGAGGTSATSGLGAFG